MRALLRAIAIVLAIMIAVLGAVGSIRWAKRHPTGAQLLASAMIMVMGVGVPIINPPQQGIEEAREDKGKKGSESRRPARSLMQDRTRGAPRSPAKSSRAGHVSQPRGRSCAFVLNSATDDEFALRESQSIAAN